jgi:hypothetical protein
MCRTYGYATTPVTVLHHVGHAKVGWVRALVDTPMLLR